MGRFSRGTERPRLTLRLRVRGKRLGVEAIAVGLDTLSGCGGTRRLGLIQK